MSRDLGVHIQCIGLSHKTADVSLREKFAPFAEIILRQAAGVLAESSLSELLVLSTCNRVEVYGVSCEPGFEQLEHLILKHSRITEQELAKSMYRLTDLQVASHLLQVSAGLDSMVLGEPQILGQVTTAYEDALDAGSTGKVLSRLFQICIHAGKRVRTETGLGRQPTSVPSVAARLVNDYFADLSKAKIAVLGAGEMADLAVGALRKRGAARFHVVSRTLASACKLAEQWQGESSSYDELQDVLADADILLTSSSAPHFLIDADLASAAMQSRPERPLLIIDIAVPRDVAPEVGEIRNIHLFDIDALSRSVDQGLDARRREIPAVEAILNDEFQTFKQFLQTLPVLPLIAELRQHSDSIRRNEVERTLRQLRDLSPEQADQIRLMTQAIVKKVLHHPTAQLHRISQCGDPQETLQLARTLFGLAGVADDEALWQN